MSLKSIREQFVGMTGREDLNTSEALGANWFINQGQRWLARRQGTLNEENRHVVSIAPNQSLVSIPQCRTIREIWVVKADGTRTRLEKISQADMRVSYPTVQESPLVPFSSLSTVTPSTPICYCMNVDMLSPTTNLVQEFDPAVGLDGTVPGDAFVQRSITIMPPTADRAVLDIVGTFYPPYLENDSDQSEWTEMYPMALVLAAAYLHEVFMRNTQGQRDAMMALQIELTEIERDRVDNMVTDVSQMEG